MSTIHQNWIYHNCILRQSIAKQKKITNLALFVERSQQSEECGSIRLTCLFFGEELNGKWGIMHSKAMMCLTERGPKKSNRAKCLFLCGAYERKAIPLSLELGHEFVAKVN